MTKIRFGKYQTPAILFLLTAGALLIHGYHPFAEDAEIYLPGVENILHPALFPAWREFFASHASLTLFPNLIAFSLRVSHLPLTFGIFFWHVASIFLLLLACWELSGLLFPGAVARWAGVGLVTALLTIPVAGTALYIVDQYLNPRNLAAFAGVFMLARLLEKKYLRALAWLVFAGCMHPLMWVFPFSFCVLLFVMDKLQWSRRNATVFLPLIILWMPLAPAASADYHKAAILHSYHYIQNWKWYELLGTVAPLALFWWFSRIASGERVVIERISRAFVVYGFIYLVMAVVLDLPARAESLARLQPLRSLHFLYIITFLVLGGFLGEFVLKNTSWRWLLLFLPLSAGMFFVQRTLFPQSAHIEWPGIAPKNGWAQAFDWVRENTPVDAVFALDPEYMHIAGEDQNGFRCRAQRSKLADLDKDSGAVSMFPPLAEEWWAQVQAQTPWKAYGESDFSRLKDKYGAGWVVLQEPGAVGLECPYENRVARVCRIP